MHFILRLIQLACAGILAIFLIAVILYCFWSYAPRGVLPSRYATVKMSPAEIETLVLRVTPIGTSRKNVEKALNEEFRCDWHERAVGVTYLSNLGFPSTVDGDELISSEFASYGLPLADVATVHFLFDADGNLKDVKARIWGDAL